MESAETSNLGVNSSRSDVMAASGETEDALGEVVGAAVFIHRLWTATCLQRRIETFCSFDSLKHVEARCMII
jgi:hypothetical protein